MPTRVLLTYSDYAALPDDGRRYELHHGELSVTPAPGTRHQGAIVNLITLLHEHVRSRGLGKVFVAPTDCILSNVTVVQPDVFYIAADRLSIISERGIEGAPTLVVEVLSPSTAHLDRGRKMSKSSRFPTATGGRGMGGGGRQFVRSACGRVTVPGLASAARTA